VKVRATLMLRNGAILEARERFGLTQKAAADAAGIPLAALTALEKMDGLRFSEGGRTAERWTAYAQKLAGLLELKLEQVIPEGLRGKRVDHTVVRQQEVEPDLMLGVSASTRRLALPADQLAQAGEVRRVLDQAMETILTYREREALALRYGLGDEGWVRSWGQVGDVLKVTRERARQIVMRAEDKLGGRNMNNPTNPWRDAMKDRARQSLKEAAEDL